LHKNTRFSLFLFFPALWKTIRNFLTSSMHQQYSLPIEQDTEVENQSIIQLLIDKTQKLKKLKIK